jgi:hypothetical protein
LKKRPEGIMSFLMLNDESELEIRGWFGYVRRTVEPGIFFHALSKPE